MPVEWRATVTQPAIDVQLDVVSLPFALPGYFDAIVCQTIGTGSECRTADQELAWCGSALSNLRKLHGNVPNC